jgi:RNA polymerase sigma-70 factor, ECF subfamily
MVHYQILWLNRHISQLVRLIQLIVAYTKRFTAKGEGPMNFANVEGTTYLASGCSPSPRYDHLVLAAQSGSSTAFAELWEIYSQRVYRRLLSITKNREDAQDALQDAFLHAYRALPAFEGRSSFYSWLTRIAINSALMVLRKRRTRAEVSFDCPFETEEQTCEFEVEYEGPSPEQICDHHQRCARVQRSMDKLRPRLRRVLEMQLSESYSIKEIALTLKVSEATVKSCLSRARAQLKRINARSLQPRLSC